MGDKGRHKPPSEPKLNRRAQGSFGQLPQVFRERHANYPRGWTEVSLRTSKPEIAASTIWLHRGSVVLLDLVVFPLLVPLLLVSVFPTLFRDRCSLAVHPCPPGRLENKTSGRKHAIIHGPLRLFADRWRTSELSL